MSYDRIRRLLIQVCGVRVRQLPLEAKPAYVQPVALRQHCCPDWCALEVRHVRFPGGPRTAECATSLRQLTAQPLPEAYRGPALSKRGGSLEWWRSGARSPACAEASCGALSGGCPFGRARLLVSRGEGACPARARVVHLVLELGQLEARRLGATTLLLPSGGVEGQLG